MSIIATAHGGEEWIDPQIDSVYSQIKVNPSIKTEAVTSEKITTPGEFFDKNYSPQIGVIKEAKSETLEKTKGPSPDELTPGEKQYILKLLGFKAVGKNLWNNWILCVKEPIQFDINEELLIQFMFRIWKSGYKEGITKSNI